ncbi:uncharacterized protein TrAtP1_010440 [Trichoderma atroviride]|uniref:uncharacterized protein n=1 Tax=Hypocrea atroviridis TaxID=63577 RepID=UPI00331B0813|nr:hypothetical protein TrAtP1_010440 [Trichoderma atroviride]
MAVITSPALRQSRLQHWSHQNVAVTLEAALYRSYMPYKMTQETGFDPEFYAGQYHCKVKDAILSTFLQQEENRTGIDEPTIAKIHARVKIERSSCCLRIHMSSK